MFLAAFYILRPITRSWPLVIEQATYAKLFRCSSIPACPISGTTSLVSKNTIKPLTVFGLNWWIGLSFTVAIVGTPWIIATLGYASMLASKYKTVWTVEQFRSAVHAFPVTIAVIYVTNYTCFCLAWILLLKLLTERS